MAVASGSGRVFEILLKTVESDLVDHWRLACGCLAGQAQGGQQGGAEEFVSMLHGVYSSGLMYEMIA